MTLLINNNQRIDVSNHVEQCNQLQENVKHDLKVLIRSLLFLKFHLFVLNFNREIRTASQINLFL